MCGVVYVIIALRSVTNGVGGGRREAGGECLGSQSYLSYRNRVLFPVTRGLKYKLRLAELLLLNDHPGHAVMRADDLMGINSNARHLEDPNNSLNDAETMTTS